MGLSHHKCGEDSARLPTDRDFSATGTLTSESCNTGVILMALHEAEHEPGYPGSLSSRQMCDRGQKHCAGRNGWRISPNAFTTQAFY